MTAGYSSAWPLEPRPVTADIPCVLRVLGLPALLVVVLVGGYVYVHGMQSSGPTSPAATQAVSQAQSAVAATNFGQAAAAMQAFYVQSGTYAGATLPPGTGVTLVRSDATSYCLQAGDEHEDGPGGQPQPGAC
jgi:hypothetical protein